MTNQPTVEIAPSEILPGISEIKPVHIAVIMDGNGRWARQHGMPRLSGHERGSRAVGECVEGCLESGIPYLTLYAFSAENWRRPEAEVKGLMFLLDKFLKEKTKEMCEKGVRLLAIGRLGDLPDACRKQVNRTMEATAKNSKLTLTLALSYSGRLEIVDAVQSLVRDARLGLIDESSVTTEMIQNRLYTAGIPDPDLLIRTSGEMRLSNFLLWQISYTEIHVTSKLWPDFTRADLSAAIADFSRRERRYGGISK